MNKKIRQKVMTLTTACALLMGSTLMAQQMTETQQLMVPVREWGETLGFKVDWNSADQKITLENGKTKVSFKIGEDAYQKSTGRLSGECIMMYVPESLGSAARMKEGKTFVPATLFDYALDEENVIVMKDEELVEKEGLERPYYKEVSTEVNGKSYSLSVNLPEYIGKYVKLTTQRTEMGDASYPLCFLTFENEDGVSNIGTFSIYTPSQYEALKAENGPMPTEVIVTHEYVVAFTGLHDMPFELGTKAAEMVGKYHSEVETILKTVTLQVNP